MTTLSIIQEWTGAGRVITFGFRSVNVMENAKSAECRTCSTKISDSQATTWNFVRHLKMHSDNSLGIMGGNCSSLDDILEEDMHHWYTKFMRESPSGLITLFELKTMLEMKGMTEEASSYVDQVFYTFDMDGDGYIDFVEYIAAISLLLKGEINQKLKWYFKLFDQDGNGKIDKEELETIFKAIQDITRSYDIPPEEIVTLIYEKIDVNGEGELTLEEFISGARNHPDIMDMLSKMMDLTNVLEIIIRGQPKKALK